MTIRLDPSVIENQWTDAQRVDQADMEVEQDYNNKTNAAIINNHFGSGVLLSAPEKITLFDSDDLDATSAALLAAGNFDGSGIQATNQPSDINLGNQLEIELTNSSVIGRLSVKVAIFGVSFDNLLQMDTFYFYRNESQVTSKHYKKILAIFFNDFKGNNLCSRNLGGKIVIKETSAFQISKDPIMVSQDLEPSIFWRDFKLTETNLSLLNVLQSAIGSQFSIDTLDINITGLTNRTLASDDIITQVGQKFLTTTNNLQKVTVLLGCTDDNDFDWSGDLVFSIFKLQDSVNCPSDIVPELAIDFEPAPQPLAQITFNKTSLQQAGYVLNDVLQPIDFVFSSSKIATSGGITTDKFYIFTLKRAGNASIGNLLIGTGKNRTENSRLSIFSGIWTDFEDEDLWFQIWTDAIKVSDGQGYDTGNGMTLTKTAIDPETQATIDNQFKNLSFFSTGERIVNSALVQATILSSLKTQNERTGDDTFSRKQFVPTFSLISESSLETLKSVSEPLTIGCITDINAKNNPTLTKTQTFPGLAKNDTFCIINPDPDILSLNLLGSKLVPNADCCQDGFKIYEAILCTDGYGDINGDGEIDQLDILAASNLVGESIYFDSSQQKILDGEFTTLELLRADVDGDGYITTNDLDLITNYVNKIINSFPVGTSFTHSCLKVQHEVGRYDGYYDCDGYVRLDGYNELNIVNPSDLSASELLLFGNLGPVQIDLDPIFSQIPFPGVTFQIVPVAFWQPCNLQLSTDVRKVPVAFTFDKKIVDNCAVNLNNLCRDLNDLAPSCDPGRVDIFVPDNLYIGKGEIIRPDGNHYKVDLEIGTIILELPTSSFVNANINIFDKLVVDRGSALTSIGLAAMKYADCTTVQPEDLALNKLKFAASIQSYVAVPDGYFSDGYDVLINDIIGVNMDETTGILTVSCRNHSYDSLHPDLRSKLMINVFLKKGGWNNITKTISNVEILGLISS